MAEFPKGLRGLAKGGMGRAWTVGVEVEGAR